MPPTHDTAIIRLSQAAVLPGLIETEIMETLSYGDSALSLVVPAVAIASALLTRRVLLT